MTVKDIETALPNLKQEGYKITSPDTPEYNCIAWAAEDPKRWWWPDPMDNYYWPNEAPRVETVEAFIRAFETLGYITCSDSAYEKGFNKIAIYADIRGVPTHAARQLNTGFWTSKLGGSYDIEHTYEGVTSSIYGSVAVTMKRMV